MKWRSRAADEKEDSGYETKETTERNVKGAEVDVVLTTEEVAPDVSVLQALLRDKFGINDNLTSIQKQNLEKANAYTSRQLTSLSFLHESKEINVNQSDVADSIEVLPRDIPQSSLEPYLSLPLQELA